MSEPAPAPAAAPLSRPRTPAAGAALSMLVPWIVLAGLAAFPLIAPVFGWDYYIDFVTRLLIISIAATSLNVLLGYGGLVALGHAGFIGVGAYTVVALADAGFSSAWMMWGVAILTSGACAAVIGAVSLRSRGVYFLMITLAFAQMLYYLAVSLRTYGGDDGYGLYTPLSLGPVDNLHPSAFYWVVLAISALVFALTSRLGQSRFGHALTGIRDNETRMQALGYPVFRLKLAAFIGAGAVAGLAGALLARHNAFVSPSLMNWTESATLVVMIVVGGLGRRWGAPVGVAIWLTLAEVLRLYTDYWHWPMGLLLLGIVFFAPRGVAALFETRRTAP